MFLSAIRVRSFRGCVTEIVEPRRRHNEIMFVMRDVRDGFGTSSHGLDVHPSLR